MVNILENISMSQHSTLSLVIPAKNEQENIAKLL
ncbi:MAG TPA: dolichol-phosphate mannosyltransferase, partial [Marinobacter hydrocarbonoclasticus]|nr:dolichol-phosphate mannosyltransferase [Marinobacter nauticus]